MNSARHITLGLVAVTLGGCTYPNFEFADGGLGGAGATNGATNDATTSGIDGATNGVSGVTNGATNGATNGVTAGSGVSSSGSGGMSICVVSHQGGGQCEYLPNKECGCNSGQKCTVVNEATGEAQCINAGPLGKFQKCDSNAQCAAGTWCDHFTGTCTKVCASNADCNGGVCISPVNASKTASIPGLGICSANCNPLNGQPCGNGVTCAFDTSVQVFDCFASLNKTNGQSCAFATDCGKGLVCAPNTKTCTPWCTAVNACPSQKPTCLPFNPPVKPAMTEFGFCSL